MVEMIEPVKAVSQLSALPTTTAYSASSTVPASEVDSSRIYGSSYSGVSFGSGFSPDNLLITDRRPVRSRSLPSSVALTNVVVNPIQRQLFQIAAVQRSSVILI